MFCINKQKNNKNDKEMTKKEQQQVYVSPEAVTIEIKAQAIICQSGNQRMDWQDLGNGGFEEQ